MDCWAAVDAGGALGEEVRAFQILGKWAHSPAVVRRPFEA